MYNLHSLSPIPARLNTSQAAQFLGCAPSTLKGSRVTGKLLGRSAPEYIKYSRKVVYEQPTLQIWLEQFGTRSSTAV